MRPGNITQSNSTEKNDHNNDHMGFISQTEKTLDFIQIKKHEALY
jgi:hypothetical protein